MLMLLTMFRLMAIKMAFGTKWSFNSDMSGETAVEPYEVTTKVVTEVINGKPVSYLDVTKKKNPTVYAYDFLYNNYGIKNTASSIASAWSDKDAEKTAELLGGTTTAGAYRAEEGRGVAGRGIRYDVVSEWESFMYETFHPGRWLLLQHRQLR